MILYYSITKDTSGDGVIIEFFENLDLCYLDQSYAPEPYEEPQVGQIELTAIPATKFAGEITIMSNQTINTVESIEAQLTDDLKSGFADKQYQARVQEHLERIQRLKK